MDLFFFFLLKKSPLGTFVNLEIASKKNFVMQIIITNNNYTVKKFTYLIVYIGQHNFFIVGLYKYLPLL